MDLPIVVLQMRRAASFVYAASLIHAAALLLACLWTTAAVHAADAGIVHRVRIADQQPPCAGARSGLPIIPNDPGAITLPGGARRCYGTRPPELELWLPHGRYLWLASQAPTPAAWIDLGPILIDPGSVEPPPLGLRITGDGAALALETRFGADATLTPVEPGRWQEVESADRRTFWIWLETATPAGVR